MAEIPDYQRLMLPVLSIAVEGETTAAKVVERVARQFDLTESQLAELLPSGRQAVIANRVHWAKFYMSKAGLIEMVRRGVFKASQRGVQLLAEKPARIDNTTLARFGEFNAFIEDSRRRAQPDGDARAEITITPVSRGALATALSPDDRIESALQEIDAGLRDDLLDRLFAIEPQAARAAFFERLVIQLLIAMGYGGGVGKSAMHVGGRGDGGVDGVIHLDALGIDRVYIQAKCYDRDSQISPAQVREFAGSLDDKKTTRGVFITTAQFSRAARDFVGGIQKQIVLIDRDELTHFMVSFGVGVRLDRAIEIKKLDEDFFEL
ncbi:restriction endonuclease [Sinorhizobium meliloti]|uniref:restriction endonuclease n=1 Tax=Rhizobium meliloti TaxID=382 RepID=UPI000FD9B1BD|nr:restriction endonuclease [Sinorhizobium meliloti]RVL83946.1 restriction endonuclease [Sinorhizobium meliloti]